MLAVASIAVFGALGCVARYFLSGGTHEKLARHYPWGTLSVNVAGGLLESGRILVAFSNASVCLLFTWLGIVVAKVP